MLVLRDGDELCIYKTNREVRENNGFYGINCSQIFYKLLFTKPYFCHENNIYVNLHICTVVLCDSDD